MNYLSVFGAGLAFKKFISAVKWLPRKLKYHLNKRNAGFLEKFGLKNLSKFMLNNPSKNKILTR